MDKKIAIIAGAGPAGLTTAYELLSRDSGIIPIVVEETNKIGGISQTVEYHGNRMDIGGHRFFSKNERVTNWWNKFMPMQGAPSLDQILVPQPDAEYSQGGPDPQAEDCVMLQRRRISRIFYLRKFFDYPISLKLATFTNMGLTRTVKAGFSYIGSMIHKRPENSLEDFYINRFGKQLYSMFFEDYTEKVWGLHPSKLGADWGSQRVKGLSVVAILKDMLMHALHLKQKKVETSLIEKFIYPKLGPGHLWETVAATIQKNGGEIRMNTRVEKVNIDEETNRIKSVTLRMPDGSTAEEECDYFFSSMPIKDLVNAFDGKTISEEVIQAATSLPYRDFITVGLLVDKMAIKNTTKLATYANRVPDTWIYIQERDVKLGRLQIFNNWSPYMVADYKNNMWIGLEYFCNEGDKMWEMSDEDFIEFAKQELASIDIISSPADVKDAVRVKIKKAYPAYHGSYYHLPVVREMLDTIDNLYCIGRNGQHRYNNMDHSMLTAMTAVDSILDPEISKNALWDINTEEEYHESK